MGRTKAFDVDEVLDRALTVFWTRGYEGASIQDLVEAMGINRGSLYAAFGDKERLYAAVLERYAARFGVPAPPGRGLAALRAFLLGQVRKVLAPGQPPGCLGVNALIDLHAAPSVAGRLAEGQAALEASLTALVRDAQATGELRAGLDAAATGRMLHGLVTGLAVLARGGADAAYLEDVVRGALTAIAA